MIPRGHEAFFISATAGGPSTLFRRAAMENLIDARTLAKKLLVTTQTLARWRTEGFGPAHIAIGRRIAYPEARVEAWLESRLRKSTSDVDSKKSK